MLLALESKCKGCNSLYIVNTIMDQEKICYLMIFRDLVYYLQFPSVLWHCCLDDRYGCKKITVKMSKIMVAYWKNWENYSNITTFNSLNIPEAAPCIHISKSSINQSHAVLTLFIWDKNVTKIRKMSNGKKFRQKSCQLINWSQSEL